MRRVGRPIFASKKRIPERVPVGGEELGKVARGVFVGCKQLWQPGRPGNIGPETILATSWAMPVPYFFL